MAPVPNTPVKLPSSSLQKAACPTQMTTVISRWLILYWLEVALVVTAAVHPTAAAAACRRSPTLAWALSARSCPTSCRCALRQLA